LIPSQDHGHARRQAGSARRARNGQSPVNARRPSLSTAIAADALVHPRGKRQHPSTGRQKRPVQRPLAYGRGIRPVGDRVADSVTMAAWTGWNSIKTPVRKNRECIDGNGKFGARRERRLALTHRVLADKDLMKRGELRRPPK